MPMGMLRKLRDNIWEKATEWLTREREPNQMPLSDFDRLRYEIRPGDVILVEGRSRISEIIKTITLSNWTHSALYIGRLHNVEDPVLRSYIKRFYTGKANDQLVIESLLGEGTLIRNISKYRDDHLRICRPNNLTRNDSQKVISYAINQLGTYYNVRQILDLARFLFPYAFLPRRWRSSLFEHNAGAPTHTVCSSMMAEAFASVHFPILPVLHRNDDGQLVMYKRNTKLITPKDFDYSPYFDVIKYPILDFDELAIYRKMPWDAEGVVLNDENEQYVPAPTQITESAENKSDGLPDQDINEQAVPATQNKQAT
ncbi:MAG: YiiX/YebB-like N1pC/P60 family cysteine hydrolase [Gammaproteobacteria bacterium]|nr:YiiX/YebB-like N1pC/P60 family cysteine hydrolase [Gammaproteobacteria bacterium]